MLEPSAIGHLIGLVARLVRHTRMGKYFFVKSFDLSFKAPLCCFNVYVYMYWMKWILCGYAIRPAVSRAGADFPRDVCLTVSRNHKVFLLYCISCYRHILHLQTYLKCPKLCRLQMTWGICRPVLTKLSSNIHGIVWPVLDRLIWYWW